MTEQKQSDLNQIWGNLDWNNATMEVLRREVRERVKKYGDINLLGKRVVLRDAGVRCEEKYTLMDMLIEKRVYLQNQNPRHWEALMGFLRSMGAKPACALPQKRTPAQRILTELSKVEARRRQLLAQLKIIRQK